MYIYYTCILFVHYFVYTSYYDNNIGNGIASMRCLINLDNGQVRDKVPLAVPASLASWHGAIRDKSSYQSYCKGSCMKDACGLQNS